MSLKNKFSALLASALCLTMLAACGTQSTTGTNSGTTSSPTVTAKANTAVSVSDTSADYDSSDYYFSWKSQSYKTIKLENGSQSITKSGVYELTGTLSDGSITVEVDKTSDKGVVYLVLNGANLSSSNSAPIYIKSAKKVVIILESGTSNTVYQGSGVTVNADSEPSAAIFSKTDLTITGSGSLNVTSDYNDAITSKDILKITDGIFTIKAAGDGIVGKDILAVKSGSITISAGKDGMRSTNDTDADMGNVLITNGTFNITAGNDAIQAWSSLLINGGSFNLVTGGGYSGVTKTNMNGGGFGGMGGPPGQTTSTAKTETESTKGIKANGIVAVTGGTFDISSTDDTVHSNGDVSISGGTFTLSSGDDGIHADGTVTVSGGKITIKNSYEGIEGTNITISGGDIDIAASDDGINVNSSSGTLTISGGDTYINAGGDGVDSNGKIVMTDGTVYVDGPTDNGNGAIDYDGSFIISGGTIVAAGSSGMAQCPGDNSTQPSILMYFTSAQAAGTSITVKDESNTVVTFTPAKQYTSAAISSAGFKTGSTYTLYSGETKVVSFTISSTVTYLNESGVTTGRSGGMGAPGGMQGGMPGGNRQPPNA